MKPLPRTRLLLILLSLLWLLAGTAGAQELPRCMDRPTQLWLLRIDPGRWCVERVTAETAAGPFPFTAMAFTPDGRLYVTRPQAGQVLLLQDSSGDGLQDRVQVVAQGLHFPNGITYHEGALYISGGPFIYRMTAGPPHDITVLVDDLPQGGSFGTGGLAVGPDGRLYLAQGAPCDACEPEDPARGAVLSFTLDGQDRQIVAQGLRNPAAVAFLQGELWTLDTARDGLAERPMLDELNHVRPGAHYGWPYCVGPQNSPDLPGRFDCAQALGPAVSFPTHSHPLALTAYTGPAFPDLQGRLLVVLSGSVSQFELRGYLLVAVDAAAGQVEDLLPAPHSMAREGVNALSFMYRGAGLWPQRPYAVAVSPEGWIYVSVSGGQIIALRPHSDS